MRRTDGMLVRQGYRVTSKWTNKYYADKEKEPLWSMALVGLENTRVLLWEEGDHWRAVISVAVGRDGEYPVAEGMIQRYNKQKPFPKFEKAAKKIGEVRERVLYWSLYSANLYSAQALARLANYYIIEKKYAKAKAIVNAIITGEINAATISEALSIVQSRYAKSRAERIESAMIWGEVYR